MGLGPCSGTCTTVGLLIYQPRYRHLSDELTGDPESCEITKIFPVDVPSAKDVNDIVDNRCGVAFPRNGDVAYARQLGPGARGYIERPCIVVVIVAVGPAESAKMSV